MTPKIAILKIGLTRNTRIAYNILTVFTKPFNRTSMESKPGQNQIRRRRIHWLLIEPVWNRNYNLTRACLVAVGAFNRTSMESKPLTHPHKSDHYQDF